MLHSCFISIALCFVYTSWHFYAFSGTNVLTRCHNASSCFLLFFHSRLLLKEIFSKLDKTKAKVPIFLTCSRSPKGRRSRATRRPQLVVAWWCGVDVGVLYITAQLETPREGYDEQNSKSSLSCETKVYRTSRRKNQTSKG
jgi:hypothetical protein